MCGLLFPPANFTLPDDVFHVRMLVRYQHVTLHREEDDRALRTGVVSMTAREARFHGGRPAVLAEGLDDDESLVVGHVTPEDPDP